MLEEAEVETEATNERNAGDVEDSELQDTELTNDQTLGVDAEVLA